MRSQNCEFTEMRSHALPFVLGSAINGIVCIYSSDNHTKVVFWNPATKEVIVVPPSLPEILPDFTNRFLLHGFGYDHVSDDFKVIRRVDYAPMKNVPQRRPHPFWEIYSLRSNSWRKFNIDMPFRIFSSTGTEVYLNGVCHWLGKTDDETIIVVPFNLSNELFFVTPIDWHDDYFSSLMVLNGFIAMITNCYDTMSFSISILGEIGVKESWTRLFDFGPLSCIERVIGVGKKGTIFFRKADAELAWFDLTTGVFVESDLKGERLICQSIIYKKNLCPIGGMNN